MTAAMAVTTAAREAILIPPTAPQDREPTTQEPDCEAPSFDEEVDEDEPVLDGKGSEV
jgi:hypothetical protein